MKQSFIRREQHFLILLFALFLFGAGAAWFFAPMFAVLSSTTVVFALFGVGVLYGVFTARFVYHLDHVNHNHHAAVWFTLILAVLIGFFTVKQQGYYVSGYGFVGLPDTYVLLGMVFGISFLVAYTAYLLGAELEWYSKHI